MTHTGLPGSEKDLDALLTQDPTTSHAQLARIAAARSDLHAALAAHPNAYPKLLEWLATSTDPTVHKALAARPTTPPPGSGQTPDMAASATSNIPLPPLVEALWRFVRRKPLQVGATAMLFVLVLVLGGWGLARLNGDGTYANATEWSHAWLSGNEVVWTVPAEEGAQATFLTASRDGKHLVRTSTLSPTQRRLTAYTLEGTSVTESWRTDFEVGADTQTASVVWRSYVVTPNSLYDQSTGEATEVPWPKGAWVSSDGDRAVACTAAGDCSLWTGLGGPNWEVHVDGFAADYGSIPLSHTLVSGGAEFTYVPGAQVLMNLRTGEQVDLGLKGSSVSTFLALADGWVLVDGARAHVFAADGTKGETFDIPVDAEMRTDLPVKHGMLTTAEFSAWVKSGDTSWAKTKWKVLQREECSKIALLESAVALPDTWYIEESEGTCVLASAGIPATVSQTKGLYRFGFESPVLVDMFTGQSAPGPAGTSARGVLVTPEMWVSAGADGAMSAYTPTK